jgi:hypothetical protein
MPESTSPFSALLCVLRFLWNDWMQGWAMPAMPESTGAFLPPMME